MLWLIRLAVAPASTAAGFRRWVIEECPVAPGRKAPKTRTPAPRPRAAAAPPAARPLPAAERQPKPGKQARLISLAGQRHDLAAVPLTAVSRIASTIAAEVDLAPGTARRVLLAHVRALQDGNQHGEHEREEARS